MENCHERCQSKLFHLMALGCVHPDYICEAMGVLFSCNDERNMTRQPIVPCEHNRWDKLVKTGKSKRMRLKSIFEDVQNQTG
ncbi:hypothetical protein TRIUR3_30186 [Triticum urartu]|uniref:Uncharacterized protein n=1 Tax=Triticum urartu TaxID=4572 RepID=M7YEY4_TRIUA|nr:hypothetical protein TRIUR3_30186 [Triticum urartu]